MAYFNNYPPYYQNPQMQTPTHMQNASQNQQPQNGGFVSVPSEDVARNYPVAYGNSVTFKNENAPYIYTKTMGFSQLDRPTFEKFKLIKEEDAPEPTPTKKEAPVEPVKDFTDDIEKLKNDLVNAKVDIDNLKADIDDLRAELEDATDTIASLKKKVSVTKKVSDNG